jgi:hypothetical protein
MVKKLLALLFISVLVFSLSAALSAQQAPAKPQKEMAAKQDRWEGLVTVTNKEKSTMVVRQAGTNLEKTVAYDATTSWKSQEHGSKKTNTIDSTQVKEGDRVICLGTFDKGGVLHATLISKRLSPQAM